jgi:AraC-like DNA-binding protein
MTMDNSACATVFSSGSSNTLDGLGAWRDWFHPILDISATQNDGEEFCSKNKVWDIGGILLSSVVAPATKVTRGKLNISRAPIDHWVITYNRYGTTTMTSAKTTLHAPPKMPFLWSLGDRTISYRTKVDRVQLLIPRDMFRGISPLFDASRGSVLNTPLGAMLGDYILFLESHLDSVARQDLPRLTESIRNMIAACVAPSGEHKEVATSELEFARRERVRQVIHLNLRSAELGPRMICKAVGISRSQLYRLFEHSGGVLRYIQRQRLLQCYAILSDPESKISIMSLAEEYGFSDTFSFRRAFRREFNHSPTEVRFAAEVGMPISPTTERRSADPTTRSYDLITKNPRIF